MAKLLRDALIKVKGNDQVTLSKDEICLALAQPLLLVWPFQSFSPQARHALFHLFQSFV